MEIRNAKVSIGYSGGTAAKGSKNFKISIPSNWISELGLSSENRDVILTFDGKDIRISRKIKMEEFKSQRIVAGHDVRAVRFYDRDMLCSLIYADFTERVLRVENYTSKKIKTAFGSNELPTWNDFIEFLKERCIPQQRAGMREYLDSIGVDAYDPIEIIKKTSGRMAEDDQWIEMENFA